MIRITRFFDRTIVIYNTTLTRLPNGSTSAAPVAVGDPIDCTIQPLSEGAKAELDGSPAIDATHRIYAANDLGLVLNQQIEDDDEKVYEFLTGQYHRSVIGSYYIAYAKERRS